MLLPFFISTHALVIAVLNFFLPIYLATSLAFSGAQIGLLYAVLSLNSLVASFPVGVVGDRYPARILTRLGLLGTVASLWWLSRAQRFWPFLLLFFALGLSLQLYRQSLDIMLFKEDDVAQNTRRLGTYNAWRMGGMTVGIFLGAIFIYIFGYPASFQIIAVLMLLLVILTWRLPLTRKQQTPLRQYGRDFWSGPVLFFVTWLFLFTLHWGAENTSMGLFLKNDLGLGPLGVGLYLSGEFITIGLTVYFYGRYGSGKLSPFAVLALGLATSGIGHIYMTYPVVAWSFHVAAGARLWRRPDPLDHLHHHRPPFPRGPHRRQCRPDFLRHHPGGPGRLPHLRPGGRFLRLPGALHHLRHYFPRPYSAGLCGVEGARDC